MSDAPLELKLTGLTEGTPLPPRTGCDNPVDAVIGMEARVMLKSVRLPPDDGLIPEALQVQIRETVAAHVERHRLTLREISVQIGVGESTVSEVLRGKYTRADASPILRKLNAWIDDDELRRRKVQPIGFYPTGVFDAIKGLAKYAKSNARIPGSQAKAVITQDHPRIVIGWGPAGCGKSIGAAALHAEDPLSILIRIESKGGTDSRVAKAIIDATGLRGRPGNESAIEFVIRRLRDSGRLLIVDEAHRLSTSGCELLRDLADVCGIPIMLLATQEFYARLTSVRTRTGNVTYDQFSRRVGYVCNLTRGLDGHGGSKRPIFSLDEVRAIFRVDNVRVTDDGAQYLCAVSCTIGLGMLGLAASIFEKALRWALRKNRVIDEALLRKSADRVLIPAGEQESEILVQIDKTLERVRALTAVAV